MKTPLEIATDNFVTAVLGTVMVYWIGGLFAAQIGRDCPRTRLHGRYVLWWMAWGFFAGGVAGIVLKWYQGAWGGTVDHLRPLHFCDDGRLADRRDPRLVYAAGTSRRLDREGEMTVPLLDHFHAPVYPRHAWQSFHQSWCTMILAELNKHLPARYFGQVDINLGQKVKADVAEFDDSFDHHAHGNGSGSVAVAVAPAWTAVATVIDFEFPDDIEVQIIDTRDGARLVGVIELVSPSNKDRESERDAFTAKCLAYLGRGIGVLVVDVVTGRRSNLHDELVVRLGTPQAAMNGPHLYAASYRPFVAEGKTKLEMRTTPLALGGPLPTMPLSLKGGVQVPVELEASYTAVRHIVRL